jgi:hypothetical protein
MTNEELIGLAVKADLCDEYGTVNYEYGYIDEILAFGKLVEDAAAAKEREACAKVCERHAKVYSDLPKTLTTDIAWASCIDIRDAIRARGEA